MSGVVVATTIRSISSLLIFALFMASLDAFVAIEDVVSPGSAICLCFMPVLSIIQSSVVSTTVSRSLFVRTFVGK